MLSGIGERVSIRKKKGLNKQQKLSSWILTVPLLN